MYIDLGTHVITNGEYNFILNTKLEQHIATLKEMLNVK